MTQDEIIELAREAGLDPDLWNYTDAFETFAKLIAAKERKEWAKEFAGMGEWTAVHMLEEREKE